MTQWEYVKGSEEDFEGAPEWCEQVVIDPNTGERGFDEHWTGFQSDISKFQWERTSDGETFTCNDTANDDEWTVIAQRRKVDNLQSRVNDANLGDALKEMFRDVPGTKIDVPSDAVYDKYNRPCKGVTIDVYDVLVAFNVTNPALQHLIKKALAVGQRGHKDKNEDLNDILASAKRAIELEESNK